jgi:putative toxin-antitoxin system antitoxin component (TIGR02293 family)
VTRAARAANGRPGDDIARFRQRLRAKRGGPHAYVALLGLRNLETLQVLERVRSGLPYEALERFQRNVALSLDELAALVQIKPRTLQRRREEGRLSPEESDRLLRATRLFGRALELFEGDAGAARTWLAKPARALGGAAPFEVAASEVGAREVENLIGRLEHGVFS